jgi:hypothetical protein
VNLSGRFRLAYLALAAIFGAAVGAFVVLERRPPPPPPPRWSAWEPTSVDPLDRQREIAKHVGVQYHLDSGKKLVNVLVGGPDPQTDPIQGIVLASAGTGVEESDFAQTTVMYRLCGDGPSCSIADGEPSVRRGIVLRREALELALYTLRYVDGVGAVIAFFPPRKGQKPTAAFLFTKRQFSGELSSPLRETFPQAKPPVPGKLTPEEHRYVDALTARWGFLYRVDRSKSGARVLVLERPQTG